jgi:DNA-binding beta-propeller fold protein YncE
MTPDERRRVAYISHTYRTGGYIKHGEQAHEISVIDVNSRSIADVIDLAPFAGPHDIEYNTVNDLLYAGVEQNSAGDNGVVIVDPSSRSVVGHIPTDAPNCHWLAVSADGTTCYVTHKEAPVVSVLDLKAQELKDQIELPGGGEEIDISADGKWVFVAAPTVAGGTPPADVQNPRLVKIDAERREICGEVKVAPVNHALRVTPGGKVLVCQMIHNSSVGLVQIVDAESMSVLAALEVSDGPFTTRVLPDASKAYIADNFNAIVSEVDLARNVVTAVLDCSLGTAPGGMHPMCILMGSR